MYCSIIIVTGNTTMKEYTHNDIYLIKEEDVIELPNKDIVRTRKEKKVVKYFGFALFFTFVLSLIIGIIVGSKRK
jgi:hypothetical protein